MPTAYGFGPSCVRGYVTTATRVYEKVQAADNTKLHSALLREGFTWRDQVHFETGAMLHYYPGVKADLTGYCNDNH